jgi:hypothetical protein
MSAKHNPAITKSEFDAIERDLRKALERWWEDEKADLEEANPEGRLRIVRRPRE